MTSPGEVERQHTLRTAVARYEELRAREILADSAGTDAPEVAASERLPASDVLELLALSEVIARKAGYGQQLAVRTARAAGASWAAIARALGMSKQAAWEAHTRWIDAQRDMHRSTGHEGLDADEADHLRRMAGSPDDGPSA
jgi:hypothetical protein